jgi:2-polyprenyl-6-methoxyphenol hydroxylase-like FAD-dependent oxidoreductase
VVGADGLRSRVARSVGAEIIEDRGDDGAAQYAYYAGLPWDGIELIIADRALTGVFPTPPTTIKPASGSAAPHRTPARHAVEPRPARRPSPHTSTERRPTWPGGCAPDAARQR